MGVSDCLPQKGPQKRPYQQFSGGGGGGGGGGEHGVLRHLFGRTQQYSDQPVGDVGSPSQGPHSICGSMLSLLS
jgi:hypothetical protein